MINLFAILLMLLNLLFITPQEAMGTISFGVDAVLYDNGFVGTQAAKVNATGISGATDYYSTFLCAQPGPVNYIHYTDYNGSDLDNRYIKPAIWNATSGAVIAYVTSCNASNVTDGTITGQLNTEVTLADGVYYRLGYASGDASGWISTTASGTLYKDLSTGYTPNQCPAVIGITDGEQKASTVGVLCIWADNSPT